MACVLKWPMISGICPDGKGKLNIKFQTSKGFIFYKLENKLDNEGYCKNVRQDDRG